MQGGASTGYKKYVSENATEDDTYSDNGVALFRVQGSGPENMQAIQVDTVHSVSIYLHWAWHGIMFVLWHFLLAPIFMPHVVSLIWYFLPGSSIAELFLLLHTT